MIKGLSPHYVTTPLVSPLTSEICTKYVLQLYVWNGDKASVPAQPTYEQTISNPSANIGDSEVNISRLINDYIDFTASAGTTTEVIDGNNQLWVQHNAIYFTDDPLDDDEPQNITTDLLVSGYGYGLEGKNPSTPTNKILLTGTEFNINKSGVFVVPILIDEDTASQSVSVTSYPIRDIDYVLNLPNTNDSAELVQYVWINGADIATDEYIEVVYNGVTIYLYVTDECKYTPVDIAFQNKEGALQFLTFFKERKDDISIKSETFESNRGQPSDSKHQFVKFNATVKSKFKVNSGFVSESENETFKQLLLSERVWLYNGDYVPLNVAKNSLSYKTRQNDRLINYEIDFDYAFNDINNI